jgi:putative oxidoreductase
VILGVAFLYIGITKLSGTGNTVQYFDAIGWGQWFRYATGLLDVAGVILILVPRSIFYGALMLTCTVGSATLISFTVLAGDPVWGGLPMKLVPLALLLLAVALAWGTRPQRMASPNPI